MKTKMGVITVVFIIFCNLFCYAQQIILTPQQRLAAQKECIESYPYIFEGKVIQQQGKKGRTSTCSVISITKIFKGSSQIKLGTIKVFTEQGINIHDGETGLSKGSTYIIFGKPSGSNEFQSIVTDNSILLTIDEPIIFSKKIYKNSKTNSIDTTAVQWGQTTYKTLYELYAYLKENGLTVQEEVAQPTMPADTTKQK
jgi:hypothetical protein